LVTGSPRVPIPLTYIDNFIDALLAAERSDVPSGSIYNVVDVTDLEQGELSQILREVSGGSIRPMFFPYGLAWLLMLGVDAVTLLKERKSGTARFRLKRTLADMRFSCAAARRDLGWEPRVSLRDGLRRTLSAGSEQAVAH
jgi:nucleoside-diphosphate-sugar epimerase